MSKNPLEYLRHINDECLYILSVSNKFNRAANWSWPHVTRKNSDLVIVEPALCNMYLIFFIAIN